jgi:uncharacterized protein (DUF1810 family)
MHWNFVFTDGTSSPPTDTAVVKPVNSAQPYLTFPVIFLREKSCLNLQHYYYSLTNLDAFALISISERKLRSRSNKPRLAEIDRAPSLDS